MDSRVSNVKKSNRSTISKQNCSLVRSEFEQLAEASNDAIRIINNDFTIRYLNQTFAEMTGVNQNNVVGKKCWEIFPSPLCHTPECRIHHVLRDEQKIIVEIERQKHDGTVIPCIVTTSPLIDSEGNIAGIVEQFRDITEIRHKEKEIKETEDRYRALIELGAEAGEAIVMLQDINGQEGIQTFFNNQWLKIIGYTNKELIGTSFFDLIHPDDCEASLKRHRQKMAGETVSGLYEMKLIRKDGTEICVELTGAYSDYQKQPVNVLYIRDITEQHRLDEELRIGKDRLSNLLEYAPVGILELDFSAGMPVINNLKANGVKDFNKYFAEHTETLAQFLLMSNLLSINRTGMETYMADIDVFNQLIRNISGKKLDGNDINEEEKLCFKGLSYLYSQLIEGIEIPIGEFSRPTREGGYKYIRNYLYTAPGHRDDFSWVMIIEVDITDRVLAENKLKEYQQHLEDIVKNRTLALKKLGQKNKKLYKQECLLRKKLELRMKQQVEFTHRLVHDLKTPLSPMLAASEILAEETNDEKLKRIALNINRGANKLNHSINDLVDITRCDIGIMQLKYCETNVIEILTEVFEFFKIEADRKKQLFQLDVSDRFPIILADPDRLKQVVMNLLENALRHTPSGGKITLRAFVSKNNLLISVIDTGTGISAAEMPHIFEPYQIVQRPEKHYNGFGLGLPLSKTIIELHGGNIWAESKQDLGTTIVFSIPIQRNQIEMSNEIK